jgi:hypothetical protein
MKGVVGFVRISLNGVKSSTTTYFNIIETIVSVVDLSKKKG